MDYYLVGSVLIIFFQYKIIYFFN